MWCWLLISVVVRRESCIHGTRKMWNWLLSKKLLLLQRQKGAGVVRYLQERWSEQVHIHTQKHICRKKVRVCRWPWIETGAGGRYGKYRWRDDSKWSVEQRLADTEQSSVPWAEGQSPSASWRHRYAVFQEQGVKMHLVGGALRGTFWSDHLELCCPSRELTLYSNCGEKSLASWVELWNDNWCFKKILALLWRISCCLRGGWQEQKQENGLGCN